ncbi:MAG: hypothetical protein FWD26_04930 [Treponema sp.]|nr:hypothetical protein [Treponema sp.]
MSDENSIFNEILTELHDVGDKLLDNKGVIKDFTNKIMEDYRNLALDNLSQVDEIIKGHTNAIVEQEQKRRQAVKETTKIEEERNEVLKESIELESELIETQKKRETETKILSESSLDNLKNVSKATLDAYESISRSILDIKRREVEEKKELLNKELENIISTLNKEREKRLIEAGFAIDNNARSLEAQLEAARNIGDQALAYQLERQILEKEINDEFDRLAEEANKEAAQKKAKLEYDVAKQEHANKIINAVTSSALAIVQAFKSAGNPILGAVFAGLTGAATAVQLAAIKNNPPKMPSFSAGGIVPGSSFTGDKVIGNLNSREGVFTLEDQKYFFYQIQGRKLGGGATNTTIIVQLDGREIAKNTVNLVNDGFYTIKARAIR